MDGLNLCASAAEIRTLTGGKIDKVQQPERDELVLTVRKDGKTFRLLLCTSADRCRAQLTEKKQDNPAEPPMFCMLLRKRLTGGRVTGVIQPKLDRVLHIGILARNELGDEEEYNLIAEIMGKYSNVILVSANGTMLDAMRHVGAELSNKRIVMPGMAYEPPPAQDKRDPSAMDERAFYAVLRTGAGRVGKVLSAAFFGLSPDMAGALAATVCEKTDCAALSEAEAAAIANRYVQFYSDAANGRFSAYTALNEYGEPIAVYPFEPKDMRVKHYDSLHEALDDYYQQYDAASRMQRHGASVRRILQNNVERCEKKLALYGEAIAAGEEAEQLRLFGELITANLHILRAGQKQAVVDNYYLDPPAQVAIPLDPLLSPGSNAQRYYKKYQKAKAARAAAQRYQTDTQNELEYLLGQQYNLSKCTTASELNELSDELREQGYIRKTGKKKPVKLPPSTPMRFVSSDGTEIFVGKNNRQNDMLTLKNAGPDEYWLHTKNIPGSHVIIKSTEPSQQTLLEAATLAAYYSSARGGENVAVDFTRRRYVKKPSGAKPGMVIYTTNKTAFVTPDEALVAALIRRTNGMSMFPCVSE